MANEFSEITLLDAVAIFWRRKKLVCASVMIAALVGVALSLSLSNRYTAEVLLAHAVGNEGGSSTNAELGGLARLAGVDINGGGASRADINLAILTSKSLLIEYVSVNDLKQNLFAERWDQDNETWKAEGTGLLSFFSQSGDPTDQEAISKLQQYLHLTQDDETGIISLKIEWFDPQLASSWANDLVAYANATLQSRAIEQTSRNIEFLTEEIERTNVDSIRGVIFSLIESQMQSRMLANTRPEYAFEVLDKALTPERKSAPRRALICILLSIIGLFVGCTLALFFEYRSSQGSNSIS